MHYRKNIAREICKSLYYKTYSGGGGSNCLTHNLLFYNKLYAC